MKLKFIRVYHIIPIEASDQKLKHRTLIQVKSWMSLETILVKEKDLNNLRQ